MGEWRLTSPAPSVADMSSTKGNARADISLHTSGRSQDQATLVMGVGGGIGQGITQITCEYIRKGGDIW